MLLQFIQLYTQIIARREETFNEFVNDFRSNNKVSQNNFHLTEMIRFFFARTFSLNLFYLFLNYSLKIIEISFVMYTRLFSYICMYIYKYMYMFVCIHIYRYLRFRKQQYNKAESFFLDFLYYFSVILP